VTLEQAIAATKGIDCRFFSGFSRVAAGDSPALQLWQQSPQDFFSVLAACEYLKSNG